MWPIELVSALCSVEQILVSDINSEYNNIKKRGVVEGRNVSYALPAISIEEVSRIAIESLADEKIDRGYVSDFIMDRYERIGKMIKLLKG